MAGRSFAELIADAGRGDELAFARLYGDVQPQLLRYLRVVARSDAEDIASETWCRVVRGLRSFSGDEAGFRSWVFTIARRQAIDWHRYEARRPSVSTAPEELRSAVAAAGTEEQVLEQLGSTRALEWIATLPADQAEVVLLRAVVGLDVARVAEVVGKRPGTVRVLAHRGLRALAARLEDAAAESSTTAAEATQVDLPARRTVTP